MIGVWSDMKHTWKIPMPPHDPARLLIPADNYALKPLPEAITNWYSIAPLLSSDHIYDVTAFYSQRKTDLNSEEETQAYNANQQAFTAAKTKGTLILYYQGDFITNTSAKKSIHLPVSFTPNCMSFCIWHSLKEAKLGAQTGEHKHAAKNVRQWYDAFAIEKFQLTKRSDILFFKRSKASKPYAVHKNIV